jgi:hemerythrin-like metal-binding protein
MEICRMNKAMDVCTLSLCILTLIIAVLVAVMAGPTSPLTWSLVGVLVLIPFVRRKFMDRGRVDWKDEYSVGIESIDQQHKKLISLINMLQTTVDYSTGEEFERECLAAVVDYTKTHFVYEEGLMSKYGYPDFEAHKAQHQKMIDKVDDLLAEYEERPERVMKEALDFLKQWLIRHINGTDKQYSEFLLSKGAH